MSHVEFLLQISSTPIHSFNHLTRFDTYINSFFNPRLSRSSALPVLGLDERHLGHSTLACLSSDNNIHLSTDLLVAALDVAHGEVLAERGAGHAAGDDSDLLAVLVDLGTLSGGGTVDDEADTAAADSCSALALGCELRDDGLRSVETTGFATSRRNNPAQTGLDGCCGVVEIVAVETHTGLETERVTSTETSELQTLRASLAEERLDSRRCCLESGIVLAVERDLETILSSVSTTADKDGVSLAAVRELQLSPSSVSKVEL